MIYRSFRPFGHVRREIRERSSSGWFRRLVIPVTFCALGFTGCNALLDAKDIYFVAGDDTADLVSDASTDRSPTGHDAAADSATTDAGSCGADLQTNAKHCGRCGHDCLGAECKAGQCSTVALVPAIAQPGGIAIDATYVYFTSKGDGTVSRTPQAGGAIEPLAVGQDKPLGVAVANGTLFWSSSRLGGLWKCTLPTCENKSKISDRPYIFHFQIKGDQIYFAAQAGVLRISIDGGAETPIDTTVSGAFAVAVDESHAYYTSDSYQVYRASISGTTREAVGPLAKSTNFVGFITHETDTVYWTHADADGTGTVFAVKTDIPNSSLATYGTNNVNPVSVVGDGVSVFWLNEGTEDAGTSNAEGELLTCPKAGCADAGPTKLASGLRYGGQMVVDENAIYFVEHGGNSSTGSIRKVAKP